MNPWSGITPTYISASVSPARATGSNQTRYSHMFPCGRPSKATWFQHELMRRFPSLFLLLLCSFPLLVPHYTGRTHAGAATETQNPYVGTADLPDWNDSASAAKADLFAGCLQLPWLSAHLQRHGAFRTVGVVWCGCASMPCAAAQQPQQLVKQQQQHFPCPLLLLHCCRQEQAQTPRTVILCAAGDLKATSLPAGAA